MNEGPLTTGRPTTSNSRKQAAARKRYAAQRAANRCGWCPSPTRGTAFCPTCRKRSTERQRLLREARTAADLCRECGAPAFGQARCKACAQIRNLRPSRGPGRSGWLGGGRSR